ncbi:hypothetical protein LRP52_44535 [Photobacterium sp. ZSDE20]|uniref:Uncharacterized protein n=1 Tax=Photobacterium pectinilyticum TaxID=2906793 RepID=A0ABT1NBQ1_9GAMM|nr:hypothetical protein [Photobacterium sp. ZSDE20]MCQ1061106.1 hypothetical protein [Photobacterium sp. ZSDE20]MDD1829238.1 hypothetical protein [Photobacterium sp. ZSDE20]
MAKNNEQNSEVTVMVVQKDGTHRLKRVAQPPKGKRLHSRLRSKSSLALKQAVFGIR